ncbi:hypothetical protein AVDCRST_MAG84-7546 [uncultured Microcoleus sp.]|uniref:Uncharacterized protein n=1 Tax=uncultured Microcoleus sp. TaxID=259945 RepID=A0A6J4Q387_9CYAN|nr:hypothetical protein AVDCRST_MAG84-7546 [uncultured Microcoleus sp.]
MRPQTGQGFDLLLLARFPRVLEFCPSVGLLLSYMRIFSPTASVITKSRCSQVSIERSGFLVCTDI